MENEIKKLSEIMLSFLVQLSYKHGMSRYDLLEFVIEACRIAESSKEAPLNRAIIQFEQFERDLETRMKKDGAAEPIKEPRQ